MIQSSQKQLEQVQDEEDDEFDFGKAKMDFFKKRARDILMDDADLEYEGNPMPLSGAYKNLKHAIKNPSVGTEGVAENKPNYMKMTFSMGRQAPAGSKLLELTKESGAARSVSAMKAGMSEGQLNPLLLSLKQKGSIPEISSKSGTKNKFLENVFGKSKTITKKEADRDRKVEALLEAYKKQDEELMRKEQEREMTKKINQKALLDKFGFSDEEEDKQLANAIGGAN